MTLHEETYDKSVGFQIAPMIDVVFVIMLFFMVMAGAVKTENELNIKLPGTAEPDNAPFADEILIQIDSDGQVTLNDEEMDAPEDKEMPILKQTLSRLKQNSDEAKQDTVVTIVSEGNAKYGRAIDVLDSLAYAKITNVTFSVADKDSD